MSDIKIKYPASSVNSVALTISLGSLASDTNLLAGRETTAVDNTSNLDLDHLLGGKVRVGSSPTAGRRIEAWVYAAFKIASGTPTYVDGFSGSDANKSLTSANVKASALRRIWSTFIDSTSSRDYYMPLTSVADLFGRLPPYWGLWIVHDTGVALDSTGGSHEFHYHRIQGQSV